MKKPNSPAPDAAENTFTLPTGAPPEIGYAEVVFDVPEPLGPVKHYRTRVGYRLHDHTQGAVITHEASPAHENAWVREQLAKGLIEEVPAPAAE